MPAWPYVNRADDRRSLEALRQGDGEAIAGLYDAYADRPADYAHSLLDDQDRAADAVRRAFAAARAGGRRPTDPGRLRGWLYALVRLQCASRDRGRAAPVAVLDDPADPRTAALVRDALAELGPGDREILHLSVRHGLTPAETGSVLRLTSRQAAVRLARARDRMENAAAAVVLPERGRAYCPDLSALVESAPAGSPGTLLRRCLAYADGRPSPGDVVCARPPRGRLPPAGSPAVGELPRRARRPGRPSGQGAITLYARDAAIAWTATVPEGVVLRPGQGRLRAGASGRITLTVADQASAGSALVTFHSASGNPYCRVSWQGASPSPAAEEIVGTGEGTE
ncbi:RNA polymerase sigma factor [Microtetraspora malaysiensis]|uniref:RNA polymerase sigma factor n=1 Tax=Microtetraspora malaysiensis TaxID=161358 RepID=UPI003D913885